MYYQHERNERKPQGPLNQTWPTMSTNGRDADAMRRYLEARHLDVELAEHNGWYPSRNANDEYLRIVIPALTKTPEHIYWQARAIDPKAFIRYQSPKGPRADALIVIAACKGEVSKFCVVVEGPMDGLAAAALGYDAIVTMGIAPPDSTIKQLEVYLEKRPTLVVFDSEPEATYCAIHLSMHLCGDGIKARVASLHTYNDLAKCPVQVRARFLYNQFERFA